MIFSKCTTVEDANLQGRRERNCIDVLRMKSSTRTLMVMPMFRSYSKRVGPVSG